MNLPNKLTVTRMIMTPFFLFALVCNFPHHYLIAMLLFIAASLTDMYDGKYARKHNLITDFGKFLDPLADKMLTTAAFLGFIALNIGTGVVWITFIVLLREFLITSLRLISAGNGKVIAANMWGKAKTVSQMVAIIYTMFFKHIMSFGLVPENVCGWLDLSITVVLWISAVLTVISGAIYVKDNFQFIDPKK